MLGTALVVPGALISACAGDQDVFASSSTASSAVTTTTAASVASSETSANTTSTVETVSGQLIPASAQMSIDFTYSVTSQGPAKNPYVAVWLEDADGDLVATVALWLLQSQKGLRWVSDLRRWDSVDGSSETIDTISSATRTPGDYQLLWDGGGVDGSLVAAGEYFVCIEAAREHGPYSLIREQVTLGSDGFDLALPDDGELTDATVSYSV